MRVNFIYIGLYIISLESTAYLWRILPPVSSKKIPAFTTLMIILMLLTFTSLVLHIAYLYFAITKKKSPIEIMGSILLLQIFIPVMVITFMPKGINYSSQVEAIIGFVIWRIYLDKSERVKIYYDKSSTSSQIQINPLFCSIFSALHNKCYFFYCLLVN